MCMQSAMAMLTSRRRDSPPCTVADTGGTAATGQLEGAGDYLRSQSGEQQRQLAAGGGEWGHTGQTVLTVTRTVIRGSLGSEARSAESQASDLPPLAPAGAGCSWCWSPLPPVSCSQPASGVHTGHLAAGGGPPPHCSPAPPAPRHPPWESYLDWTYTVWIPGTKRYTFILTLT